MKSKFNYFLIYFFIINTFSYGIDSSKYTKEEMSKLIAQYAKAGKISKAKKETNKYIKLYPHDKKGYCYLVKIEKFLKNRDGAEKAIIKGLKKTNDAPILYYLEGTLYPNIDNSFALMMMEIALEREPNNVEILLDTSELNQMNNNYERAIELSKKIININSSFARAYFIISESYYRLGRLDEAKSYLYKGISLGDERKYLLTKSIYLSDKLKENSTVIRLSQKYYNLYGIDQNILVGDGKAHYSMKHYNKSKKVFELGIKEIKDTKNLTIRDIYCYTGLGFSNLKLKNIEQAKNIFTNLNKLYPLNRYAFYGLGEIYFLEKKYSKAKEYFKYYLEYPLEDNNLFIDNNEVKIRLKKANKIIKKMNSAPNPLYNHT